MLVIKVKRQTFPERNCVALKKDQNESFQIMLLRALNLKNVLSVG